MAVELQNEKAFQKQLNVFNGKQRLLGKEKDKRYVKEIGLGYKTPKVAYEGTYVDHKCPFTSSTSIRGRILNGVVKSAKMRNTVIVRRDYLHYVTKYERYEKRHRNIPAHCSPAFGIKEGDRVIIGQCRPLSKTVRFNVIKVVDTKKKKVSTRRVRRIRQIRKGIARGTYKHVNQKTVALFAKRKAEKAKKAAKKALETKKKAEREKKAAAKAAKAAKAAELKASAKKVDKKTTKAAAKQPAQPTTTLAKSESVKKTQAKSAAKPKATPAKQAELAKPAKPVSKKASPKEVTKPITKSAEVKKTAAAPAKKVTESQPAPKKTAVPAPKEAAKPAAKGATAKKIAKK